MVMRVDKPRNDGITLRIDNLCPVGDELLDFLVAADSHNPVAGDGYRLFDTDVFRVIGIRGNDFAVQNHRFCKR